MTTMTPNSPWGTAPLVEILLAETAIRIELPPSWHRLAVDRYEAVRKHVEREGSPLKDRVALFYPQGSMAIGATIRSRRHATDYDIDIVAELLLTSDTSPSQVLDLLFEAINGPPGSRYHGKVERQTRCVTVYYEDGMHLDVTPSILLDPSDPRISYIFHANPDLSESTHRRLVMNSHGFARWFNQRTPIDIQFSEAYRDRALAHERESGMVALAEADAEPVPDHSTQNGGKSTIVVGLQLLKRNRNILYSDNGSGRIPPSVFLSTMAGKMAAQRVSISQSLELISRHALGRLEAAQESNSLIRVVNPVCAKDVFTDRWPEDLPAQKRYIDQLHHFRTQLHGLVNEGDLESKKKLLSGMFGEDLAESVIARYAKDMGLAVRSGQRSVDTLGRIVPTTTALSSNSTGAGNPRKHTFYGGRLE